MKRQELTKNLHYETFLQFYYLKEELVSFSRKEKLQTSGNEEELTNRISHYLKTGENLTKSKKTNKNLSLKEINLSDKIEGNFVCSEIHRFFYKKHIGNNFSFIVPFQNWLKANTGKTYKDSIDMYYKILEDKKKNKFQIGKQFEYNNYIRDFFENNKDKSLKDAIKCWKYKKSLIGHNKYKNNDLIDLDV
ncbi:DUF6434 domain-containing protein [Miniphocaeibacter massiliensis]|uniref:DUF6434 domain-containing protein n=1 Tax=Miniphocaeibacter massiliensis TaxID=2041841 RepID=UPI000C08875A|nr:DUF6434 domain-containing protein [Miniphocaeibacter massiliensis]